MNYAEITIRDREYKLSLTTRGLVSLEKALGMNPVQIFMDIESGTLPKMADMIIILHSMLQQYNHSFSMDRVYDLVDDFLADGHNMFDLIPVFVDVFKAAGFLEAEVVEDNSKN